MKKILIKSIVLLAVVVVLAIAISSFKPVLTNKVALGQMENSNELFAAHEAYNRIAPFIDYIPLFVAFVGTCLIFIKEIKK